MFLQNIGFNDIHISILSSKKLTKFVKMCLKFLININFFCRGNCMEHFMSLYIIVILDFLIQSINILDHEEKML